MGSKLAKVRESLKDYNSVEDRAEDGIVKTRVPVDGIGVQDAVFCGLILKGCKLEDAWEVAYGDVGITERAKRANAKKKLENEHIKGFLEGVRADWKKYRLLDMMGKRQVLHDLVMDEDLAARDRINAIKVDNDMTGDVVPKKVEVDHKSSQMAELMERIRADRAKKVTLPTVSPEESLERRLDDVIPVEAEEV